MCDFIRRRWLLWSLATESIVLRQTAFPSSGDFVERQTLMHNSTLGGFAFLTNSQTMLMLVVHAYILGSKELEHLSIRFVMGSDRPQAVTVIRALLRSVLLILWTMCLGKDT